MTVECEEIPGFAGYGASSDAQIFNLRTGRTLAQRRAGNGAMQVHIGKSTVMVHYLVARAVYGRPPCRGYRVRHRNGDLSDNRAENLLWGGKPHVPAIVEPPRQDPSMSTELELEYARVLDERHSLIELMQT